jgi:autotransporter-associated beta strand protein
LVSAASLLAAHLGSQALAQSGTWTSTTSGNWSNTANWAGATVADGTGNSANFNSIDLTGDITVHLDAPRTISGLIFGDTNASTAGGWTLDANGDPAANVLTLGTAPSITVNALGSGKVATVSTVIAGSTGLTKSGAGELVLSATNTYTGTTVINGGTLSLDFKTGAIANNVLTTAAMTWAGGNLKVIGADGINSQQSAGAVTLNTGLTNVNVTPGAGGTATLSLASVTKTVNGGGTAANNLNVGGAVRFGTTGAIKIGSAASNILLDAHNNAYATFGLDDYAATDASGNVIAASNANYADWTSDQTINGFAPAGGTRFSNTASAITVANSNTSTLRSILVTSTSLGGTINGGFIRPNRVNSGSGANAPFVIYQNSLLGDLTIGANISNASSSTPVSLVKAGAGRVVLTAANGYSGATFIDEGTLSIGNDAFLGSNANVVFSGGGALEVTGNVTSARNFNLNGNGNLTVTGTSLLTHNGLISGVGALTKAGSGVASLTGTNTYTGGTVVNGGALRANNAAGSATGTGSVQVNTGAAIGGSGTFGGSVFVHAGAHVAPGNSTGTLNVNTLTLDSGSQLDFEFNLTGQNDQINVLNTDGLTLNGGAFSLYTEGTTSPFSTAGTYTLAKYVGSLLGAGTTALSVANPQSGFTYNFAANSGLLTLTIGSSLVDSQWIGASGGSWTTAGNWSSGIPNAAGTTARFLSTGAAANAGTVSLDGDKTIGVIVFNNSNSYTIAQGSGGNLNLDNNGLVASITDTNGNHTILAPASIPGAGLSVTVANPANALTFSDLSGGDLNKEGAGVLVLNGAGNYGNTNINAGVLQVGAGTTSGSLSGNNVTNNAALKINRSDGYSLGNTISGTGSVSNIGAGITTISANNTYTGGTNVVAGTIKVGNANALGTGSVNVATGATLDLDSNSITVTGLTGGGVVTTGNGSTVTLNLNIASTSPSQFDGSIKLTNGGAINLGKLSAGIGTLTGSNQLNTMSVSAGTLAFNGPNSTQTFTGGVTLTSGGSVRVDSGTVTFGNVTLGTSGSTSGDNSRFTIAGGNVTVNNYSAFRTTSAANGDITTGLQITGGVATFNSIVVDKGNSAGAFAMSGGNVTINAATGGLILGNGTHGDRPTLMQVSGGTLTYNGSDGLIVVSNTTRGVATFSGGVTTLQGINVNATQTPAGNGTLAMSGGTVYLGGGGINATSPVDVTNAQIANVVLNSGTLGATTVWSSSLPMTLTGVNGGINLKAADSAGVANNITLSGVLSGTGQLTKVGAGTVTLSGNNSYTGLTNVQAGVLSLINDGSNNAHAPLLASGADITGGQLLLDYQGNSANDPAASDPAGFKAKFASKLIKSSAPLHNAVYVDDTGNGKVKLFAALSGDIDLDNSVTSGDFSVLANHFNSATSNLWADGDFNYDGVVNALDFNLLANNFGVSQSLDAPAPALGALVPEPASLGMIALAAGAMATRRRRRA